MLDIISNHYATINNTTIAIKKDKFCLFNKLLLRYNIDPLFKVIAHEQEHSSNTTTGPVVATAQTSESIRFINRLQVTSPISIVCEVKNKNSQVQVKLVSY